MSLVLLPILLSFSYAQKATPFTGSSPTPSLYGQATEAMLNRSFPSPRIEYLLLDLHNGQTIAMRWPHSENPIPVGSLLKPFVAAAYAKSSSGSSRSGTLPQEFPTLRCSGKTDGCWRRGGHGSLRFEQALAESCNAYFLFLARDLIATAAGVDAMRRVSKSYGLSAPPGSASPANRNEDAQPRAALPRIWIGATPEWRVSPMSLAHAYAQFPVQSDDAFVGHLLAGRPPGGDEARRGCGGAGAGPGLASPAKLGSSHLEGTAARRNGRHDDHVDFGDSVFVLPGRIESYGKTKGGLLALANRSRVSQEILV